MKQLLIGLFSMVMMVTVCAQEKHFQTPAILNLVEQADSCYKQAGEGCDILYKKAMDMVKDKDRDDLDLIIHKLCIYYLNRSEVDSLSKYVDYGIKNAVKDNAVEAFMNLKGTILYNDGKLEESASVFIELAERLEKSNKTDKLAYVYANLGNQYASLDEQEHSLEYLNKSYDILKDLEDTLIISMVAGNIADGHMNLNNDSAARHWSYITLGLSEKAAGNYDGKILAYTTLARVMTKIQTDSALIYIKLAEDLAFRKKDNLSLATTLGYKAIILKNLGQYKSAQVEIDKSIELYKKAGFLPGLISILKEGGDISCFNKQYEKAARYFQDHIHLSDSLKSVKRYEKFGELTIKYETEKKERQLAEQQLIIQKKNAQIRNWLIGGAVFLLGLITLGIQYRRNQQRKIKLIEHENENAVLKAMMNGEERERNRISKDLHDGVAAMLGAVKMSLQSIPFLSEERRNEQLEKTAELISNTHTDVRRIAHDLLPVILEKDGLIAALEQFCADLNQMNIVEITLKNHLNDGFSLPQRTELMLYRIIQELINNIMKHSQATQASIGLSHQDNVLFITVEDNGIGFIQKLDNQGLYSIKERVTALGGTFDIKGEKGKGTKVSLALN